MVTQLFKHMYSLKGTQDPSLRRDLVSLCVTSLCAYVNGLPLQRFIVLLLLLLDSKKD